MSSKPSRSNSEAEQNRADDRNGDSPDEDTADSAGLKITLPEGSESVSDAIVTHREMLNDPQEHGLATDQDITHLSEAVETMTEDVDKIKQQYEENESEVIELRECVQRQQEQIDELQSMVTSLAEILGTETDWRTFDGS